jgi:hypothetical protein
MILGNDQNAILRTDSGNEDFRKLIVLLDQDLQVRDGEEHSFYAQFNKIDAIKHTIVAYQKGEPVGCGAIKQFSEHITEIKRMLCVRNFGVRELLEKSLMN